MSQESKLKVNLETKDLKAEFSGDVGQVLSSINEFLIKIYPNLEILQRFTYNPNFIDLAENISDLLKVTPDGPILTPDITLPSKNLICLVLLGVEIGRRLGLISKKSLSSSELSSITGKARKTIMNEAPKLVADGLINKTDDGEYSITILGINHTEKIIKDY